MNEKIVVEGGNTKDGEMFITRERWTPEEKELWNELYLEHGNDYKTISKKIGTKTEYQCAVRKQNMMMRYKADPVRFNIEPRLLEALSFKRQTIGKPMVSVSQYRKK